MERELFEKRYRELRTAIVQREFSSLNDMQQKAVCQTQGPLLVLAGAGSGKTTVLVNRIANLIRFGDACHSLFVPPWAGETELSLLAAFLEHPDQSMREQTLELCAVNPCAPWNILAITFTNKAAEELRARICRALGDEQGNDVWASTFHSACVRILRREIHHLGRERSFTIYDADDSLRIIKEIIKNTNVDEKRFAPRSVQNQISNAKNEMLDAEAFAERYGAADFRMKVIGEIYREYQRRLRAANALDFDDLIFVTVQLLETSEEVRSFYQRKFRYVLVDEYQDTNQSQSRLVELLAGGYHNICVVGDDDQSIYRFRGATVENILGFEKTYPGAAVIRLEQNYRSTKTILDAANQVIAKNEKRAKKTLWTNNGSGVQITLYRGCDDQTEAMYIADTILKGVKEGRHYNDYAVLYRMNAQSALLERTFSKLALPHRIIGGVRFYDRKEIKDMLAYLSLIVNPNDDHRLKRIINEPKRGIGSATVDSLEGIATSLQKSMLSICNLAHQIEPLQRSAGRLCEFYDTIERLAQRADTMPLGDYVKEVAEQTGYLPALRAQNNVESEGRIENIMELVSNAMAYERSNEGATLEGFLEEVSLLSDIDNHDPTADSVALMTVHSAKGLEFPIVVLYGMEEEIFPSAMSMNDPRDLEEERRLCYVALTRAKDQLILTRADERLLYGRTVYHKQSRFVEDIPSELLCAECSAASRRAAQATYGGYRAGPAAGKQAAFGSSSMFGSAASAAASASSAQSTMWQAGERVKHNVFGLGTVLQVRTAGNDCLLEVAFDDAGTKKLMANFAKLQKQ